MEPVLKSKIAVIGGGPAGCACAFFLKQIGIYPVIFEKNSMLNTLLPTGGGRCNLAYGDFDIKSLASNYPRGEKFLYSVFSRFSTAETLAFFEDIGVKTYMQEDGRFFPVSNSAADVRRHIIDAIQGVKVKNENVNSINTCRGGFEIKTDKAAYFFEKVIIAIGGHSALKLIKNLGHTIAAPVPSLTALKTSEDLSELAGVSLKNIKAKFAGAILGGDLLFTHNGVSGPLIYKISSLMARKDFPYKISFDFAGQVDLQNVLNENSQKSVKNIISDFVPKSLGGYILKSAHIDGNSKCAQIDGKMRDKILKYLNEFEINVVSAANGGEVVTCGGVSLDEVNSKTMQSKIVPNLFFCGEVLDIDGFCGGFNLQNCWSTAFVAAEGAAANG